MSNHTCHYWYLLGKGFKFQTHVSNSCHDLLIMYINLDNIVISNINGDDCRCIISEISKSEAVKLLQNADLTGKIGIFKNITLYTVYKNRYKKL